MTEAKRGCGRPATWEYPERIDASPEEIAQLTTSGGTWKRRSQKRRNSPAL